MPRATRNRKPAIAVPQPGEDTSKKPATTALQSKSTNTRTRPTRQDAKGKRNEVEQLKPANDRKRPLGKEVKEKETEPPKAKKRAGFAGLTKAAASEPEPQHWDVTGEYSIRVAEKGRHNFDTTNYSLKIFYCDAGTPRSLYATFTFDLLEGKMRLCPFAAMGEPSKFDLAAFEKACNLSENDRPGPKHPRWLTRWRGTDGGMRLNKKVGGEHNVNCTIDFTPSLSSPSDNIQGMDIEFVMIYNNNFFTFKGTKVANHPPGIKAIVPWSFERGWNALYDPHWDNDSDSDSESEYDKLSKIVKLMPKSCSKAGLKAAP